MKDENKIMFVAVESDYVRQCSKCVFYDGEKCECKIPQYIDEPLCFSYERKDGRNVYWKLAEEEE